MLAKRHNQQRVREATQAEGSLQLETCAMTKADDQCQMKPIQACCATNAAKALIGSLETSLGHQLTRRRAKEKDSQQLQSQRWTMLRIQSFGDWPWH